MPLIRAHTPGTFCWIDLETTDTSASRDFYTKLFGWEVVPLGNDTHCFQINGHEVAAMSARQRDRAEWVSYVAVDELERTVSKAEKLGARVVTGPTPHLDGGKTAAIAAPDQAVIGLRDSPRRRGVSIRDELNTLCWNELLTRAMEASKRFYSAMFGWRSAGQADYTEFRAGENAVGGMLPLYAKDIESRWLPYFAVADCDRSLSMIADLGGVLLTEPREIAGIGRFALAEDAQGAAFAVIRLLQ